MKEITILSGKGGTGKTSITAAFASLSENIVLCDNDVDAADLHLILHPKIINENIYYSAWLAEIDNDLCTQCGNCFSLCRFDAISLLNDKYLVNPYKCEGCKLCERTCPAQAIVTHLSDNNAWFVSATRFGTMVNAKMGPGEENSGKLVSLIRKEAKEIAQKRSIFVSELLMVSSADEKRTIIIEKTPEKTDVYENDAESVICTNHFQGDILKNEHFNITNIKESSTMYRYNRVNELLNKNLPFTAEKMAELLREKKGVGNAELGLSNEKAINQLKAHHSVIFIPEKLIMYVSASPYNLGEYMAYNINNIFDHLLKIINRI